MLKCTHKFTSSSLYKVHFDFEQLLSSQLSCTSHSAIRISNSVLNLTSLCTYLLFRDGSSARLHSGLMSSHFHWTVTSVSLTSPKCVILAITNLALINQGFSTTMSFNELCHTSLMLLIGLMGKTVNQFYLIEMQQ